MVVPIVGCLKWLRTFLSANDPKDSLFDPDVFSEFKDLRVWRTNPGSVFDYDPAEDNIQSRSLHMMSGEA